MVVAITHAMGMDSVETMTVILRPLPAIPAPAIELV
jgi:hypothetical protein